MNAQKQFLEEICKPADQIDIETCALLFASDFQPDLNVSDTVLELDDQVSDLLGAAPAFDETGTQNARFLTEAIGDVLGYRGDNVEYHSVDNSFLNKVIATRLGMPITLAAIYIAVGKRLGISVHGVGFPGHYLIRVREADGAGTIVDPFAHKVISTDQFETLKGNARINFGGLYESWITDAHPHDFLLRMLENLKATYLNENALVSASKCLKYQLVLRPDDEHLKRQMQMLLKHIQDDTTGSATMN